MCGICGTAGFVDPALLTRMCAVMRHRGPDDEGYFTSESVGLGIRRLSVIDLQTGHQPVFNEDRTVCVVLNGEIYNYRQLRKELEAKGHSFSSKSDTETIVHLYEEEGEDCVTKLNGMFAFAIWDSKRTLLFIARDRLGVKPLYYAVRGGKLTFASELKALLESPEIGREVDLAAIDRYLHFLYIPAPQTVFKGISKLLPGHSLTFKGDSVSVRRYWDLVIDKNRETSEDFYIERTRELLKTSVADRLNSDVPLGVFLSGGVDSSTVLAMAAKMSAAPISTFTIGYGSRDASFNELEIAELVSREFNTRHHQFIVDPDLGDIVRQIVWHLDEPFADSSAVPVFLVSRLARKHITVALSGIGGDELFSGYPRYLGARLSAAYEKLPYFLRRTAASLSSLLPESTTSRNLAGWAKRFTYGGLLPERERYIHWLSVMNRNERKRLYSAAMMAGLGDADPWRCHEGYFDGAGEADFLDRIMYLDVKTYLTDDLLHMTDRMSMAHSLEVRAPFCDYRFLEFSASIPSRLKLRGMDLKYLLKKAAEGLVPAQVLQAPKHGFMMPLGRWLKDDLKELIRDLLSETSVEKRNYFNYDYIRWILGEHEKGTRNYDDRIWALCVLELWHRAYIDRV